jgi:hypothetical protein
MITVKADITISSAIDDIYDYFQNALSKDLCITDRGNYA